MENEEELMEIFINVIIPVQNVKIVKMKIIVVPIVMDLKNLKHINM